jgi:hypothetical protein
LAGQKWGFFGSGRSRERAGARHFLCHVSRDTKRPTATFPVDNNILYKISDEVFFERISDERVSITMRTTFGACRKDGVFFITKYFYFIQFIVFAFFCPAQRGLQKLSHY